MTAPALIALAHDSGDQRAAHTISALTELVACMRPDLHIEAAYMRGNTSNLKDVASRLAADGHDEIVIVPLALTVSPGDEDAVADLVASLDLQVTVTSPLGFEAAFLNVLDKRLRTALTEARVRELDGLVLAASGSTNLLENQTVARVARAWGKRHNLPTIAAFAAITPPAAGEAVRSLRADGRRHIAVGQLFLTAGPLADVVSELSLEAGAVAVSEPLGVDTEIARAVLARYAVGAVALVPLFA